MMMERILLGALYLSGWHIFSTGLLHHYHNVRREKYTDLATVENTEEMNQLINTVSSVGYSYEAWIGLYGDIEWRWSDKGGSNYTNGETLHSKPNFKSGNEFCVNVVYGGWWDDNCSKGFSFICYNGTQLDPEFVFVNETRNWSSSQTYCRENFIDLATVRSDAENQEIQNLPSGAQAWIDAFRELHIHWSDGSGSSFRYWDDLPIQIDWMSVWCGALWRSGRWMTMPCDSTFPFDCYSAPPAAPVIMKRAVKLVVSLKDSSVDLNDPAVKADILKKLQDRLTEGGVKGVTLKWREQPDGKVFKDKDRRCSLSDTPLNCPPLNLT